MDTTSNSSLTLQVLPQEVIINCLSFLNIQDLKSCRLVSHQFNSFILESPEIMRKFKIKLQLSIEDSDTNCKNIKSSIRDPQDLTDLWNFVESKGHFIRCVELNLNEFEKFSWNFLSLLPNLEDLRINEKEFAMYAFTAAGKEQFDLSKLKSLNINSRLLKSFMSSTKNCNKLQKLTIKVTEKVNQELLREFVAQQRNLKVLILDQYFEKDSVNFLTSNFNIENFYELAEKISKTKSTQQLKIIQIFN